MYKDEKARNLERRLVALKIRAEANVDECILPFWTSDFIRDPEHGGYYGCVTIDMRRNNDIDRALVLYGRMVYAFANGYRLFRDPKYQKCAKYTFDYLVDKFWDDEFGGAFSSITTEGRPFNTDKSVYSEAFFVMACAAYYGTFKDERALDLGMRTFQLIEETRNPLGVYPSNVARNWKEQTAPTGKRSFPKGVIVFPHHLCQAYEQFYRATGDKNILSALYDMSVFIADKGFDKEKKCFITLVEPDGKPYGTMVSFGHDCEISYLAYDVANLVGEAHIIEKIEENCRIALNHLLDVGYSPYHGLYNGFDPASNTYINKHTWWVQAESAMAMLFGFQLTGEEKFLTACEQQFDFIDRYFVNHENGDWYNDLMVDEWGAHTTQGSHGTDKLNAGKCPFHNSHMCYDMVYRIYKLLGVGENKQTKN